jgi:hypothetical protein
MEETGVVQFAKMIVDIATGELTMSRENHAAMVAISLHTLQLHKTLRVTRLWPLALPITFGLSEEIASLLEQDNDPV